AASPLPSCPTRRSSDLASEPPTSRSPPERSGYGREFLVQPCPRKHALKATDRKTNLDNGPWGRTNAQPRCVVVGEPHAGWDEAAGAVDGGAGGAQTGTRGIRAVAARARARGL